MTGDQLRKKLVDWGFQLSEVASKLGMSPQAFNSKLNVKDLTLTFIIDVATAIKKNVYEIVEVKSSDKIIKPSSQLVEEPGIVYHSNVDDSLIKMPVMDMQFAAGVSSFTPEYLETVEHVYLPKVWLKKGKTYACGRIRGESMSPTLLDSGYGIIRLLNKNEWGNMPNEEIHIVVTKDSQFGNLQVKRVKNRLSQGFLVMMSDNPDKASFPNFNIYNEEIVSIWHMDWYFTSRMPNIHNQYYSRLQALEDKVDDLLNDIKPIIKSKK